MSSPIHPQNIPAASRYQDPSDNEIYFDADSEGEFEAEDWSDSVAVQPAKGWREKTTDAFSFVRGKATNAASRTAQYVGEKKDQLMQVPKKVLVSATDPVLENVSKKIDCALKDADALMGKHLADVKNTIHEFQNEGVKRIVSQAVEGAIETAQKKFLGERAQPAQEAENQAPGRCGASLFDYLKQIAGLSGESINGLDILCNSLKKVSQFSEWLFGPESEDAVRERGFFKLLYEALEDKRNGKPETLNALLRTNFVVWGGVNINISELLHLVKVEENAVDSLAAANANLKARQRREPKLTERVPFQEQFDINLRQVAHNATHVAIMSLIQEKIFHKIPENPQFYNKILHEAHIASAGNKDREKALIEEALCANLPLPFIGKALFKFFSWLITPWVEGTLSKAKTTFDAFIHDPKKLLSLSNKELKNIYLIFDEISNRKIPAYANGEFPEELRKKFQRLPKFSTYLFYTICSDYDDLWKVFNLFVSQNFISYKNDKGRIASIFSALHHKLSDNRVYSIFYNYLLKWIIQKPYEYILAPASTVLLAPIRKLRDAIVRKAVLRILDSTQIIQTSVERGMRSIREANTFTYALDMCLARFLKELREKLDVALIEQRHSSNRDELLARAEREARKEFGKDSSTQENGQAQNQIHLSEQLKNNLKSVIITGMQVLYTADANTSTELAQIRNSLKHKIERTVDELFLQPAFIEAGHQLSKIGIEMLTEPEYLYQLGDLFVGLCNTAFEYTPEQDQSLQVPGRLPVRNFNEECKALEDQIDNEIDHIINMVTREAIELKFAETEINQAASKEILSSAQGHTNVFTKMLHEKIQETMQQTEHLSAFYEHDGRNLNAENNELLLSERRLSSLKTTLMEQDELIDRYNNKTSAIRNNLKGGNPYQNIPPHVSAEISSKLTSFINLLQTAVDDLEVAKTSHNQLVFIQWNQNFLNFLIQTIDAAIQEGNAHNPELLCKLVEFLGDAQKYYRENSSTGSKLKGLDDVIEALGKLATGLYQLGLSKKNIDDVEKKLITLNTDIDALARLEQQAITLKKAAPKFKELLDRTWRPDQFYPITTFKDSFMVLAQKLSDASLDAVLPKEELEKMRTCLQNLQVELGEDDGTGVLILEQVERNSGILQGLRRRRPHHPNEEETIQLQQRMKAIIFNALPDIHQILKGITKRIEEESRKIQYALPKKQQMIQRKAVELLENEANISEKPCPPSVPLLAQLLKTVSESHQGSATRLRDDLSPGIIAYINAYHLNGQQAGYTIDKWLRYMQTESAKNLSSLRKICAGPLSEIQDRMYSIEKTARTIEKENSHFGENLRFIRTADPFAGYFKNKAHQLVSSHLKTLPKRAVTFIRNTKNWRILIQGALLEPIAKKTRRSNVR